MGTLDGSILNVALPTIAADLDCRIDQVAWVVMAYSATLVALMMVFGAWVQRRGYPFAYKFGYIAFVAGSLICVLSSDINMLIAGRVVQAIGAAMFQAVGIGLVTEVFPSADRGKGIGTMVMMVSAGLMSGPPIGGFLLQYFPWQSIFIINLPIGILALILCQFFFRGFPLPTATAKMHLAGAAVLAIALLTGMLGLSFMDEYPLISLHVGGNWVLMIVAAILFLRWEAQPQRALIGLDIFHNAEFSLRLVASLLLFVAMAGSLVLLPFFLQDVKGLSPQTLGLYLMILPVTMFFTSRQAGWLSDRFGFRILTTGGLLLVSVGFSLFQWFELATQPWFIALSLGLIGFGTGLFGTPNASAVMGSIPPRQRATASGIVSTTRNLGMAIGIAVATGLFAFLQNRTDISDGVEAFLTPFHQVALLSIVAAFAGAVISLTRRNR